LLRPLIWLCYVVLAILAFKYLMSHVISWFMPFIIAFFISRLAIPLARLMRRKLRFPHGVACTVGTILVMLAAILAVGLLGFFIVLRLIPFFKDLPHTYANAMAEISMLGNRLSEALGGLPQSVVDTINQTITSLPGKIDLYAILGQPLLKIAGSVPTAILSTVGAVVGSFLLTIYDEAVTKFARALLPKDLYTKVSRTYHHLFTSLGNWLKAQCIMCSICLVELSVGFWIMGFDSSFMLAFIVAWIDFLPVLGAGTVLIPWALIALLLGNFKLAISMAILYAVILVVRNMIEPHIVAHQIGLHPLVTLVGICVGFRMFGFMGMFMVPLMILCIVKLNEWGYIHLWTVEPQKLSAEPPEKQ
jgi:sporulation integral membrane protein YtvI